MRSTYTQHGCLYNPQRIGVKLFFSISFEKNSAVQKLSDGGREQGKGLKVMFSFLYCMCCTVVQSTYMGIKSNRNSASIRE